MGVWTEEVRDSVARAVATGPGCRAYVTGTFAPVVTSKNSLTSFLSVWSAGGVELESKTFAAVETKPTKTGFSTVFSDAIAYSPPRGVYVAGKADGSLFGQPAIGGLDAFVVKFKVPSEPVAIAAVTAIDIGGNAVEIQFALPSTEGSALTGFQVELSKNGVAFGAPIDVQVAAVAGTKLEKIVLGLTGQAAKGDRLSLRLRAVNLFGPAAWSPASNEVVVGGGGGGGGNAGQATAGGLGLNGGGNFLIALYVGLGALGCLIPCALLLASVGLGSIFVYRHMQRKKDPVQIEQNDRLIGGVAQIDEEDGLELLEALGVMPPAPGPALTTDRAQAAFDDGEAALRRTREKEEPLAQPRHRVQVRQNGDFRNDIWGALARNGLLQPRRHHF